MCLNHPEAIPTIPNPQKNLSFVKLMLGAKKAGDHCSTGDIIVYDWKAQYMKV